MWQITAVAHIVLTIAYFAVAWIIGGGLTRQQQWRSNPLAVSTFAIFLTCAIGHGVHVEHALLGVTGREVDVAEASILTMSDASLVLWTPLTALAAIGYFAQRARLRALHGETPLVEDLVKRQQEARLLHDGVMASVHQARKLLRQGDEAAASAEIARAMNEAEAIITEFLRSGDGGIQPGDLRRGDRT